LLPSIYLGAEKTTDKVCRNAIVGKREGMVTYQLLGREREWLHIDCWEERGNGYISIVGKREGMATYQLLGREREWLHIDCFKSLQSLQTVSASLALLRSVHKGQ
jgi:hypothetical protein